MIGEVFGRLTVLKLDSIDKNYNKKWLCQCSCGNQTSVRGERLRSGRTKSCGCYAMEFRRNLKSVAAVERRKRTKQTYKSMIERCYNPVYVSYHAYGGKGVTVCDRWRFGEGELNGWECFFADVGPKPNGARVGRKDKTKGYIPGNFVWAMIEDSEADQTTSGRPRKRELETNISDEDAWIMRALKNKSRMQLTAGDLRKHITPICPMLKIPLTYKNYGKIQATPSNYATLDRIDPAKGYTPDNIHIISHRANAIKNDATLQELQLITKNLAKTIKKMREPQK